METCRMNRVNEKLAYPEKIKIIEIKFELNQGLVMINMYVKFDAYVGLFQ